MSTTTTSRYHVRWGISRDESAILSLLSGCRSSRIGERMADRDTLLSHLRDRFTLLFVVEESSDPDYPLRAACVVRLTDDGIDVVAVGGEPSWKGWDALACLGTRLLRSLGRAERGFPPVAVNRLCLRFDREERAGYFRLLSRMFPDREDRARLSI